MSKIVVKYKDLSEHFTNEHPSTQQPRKVVVENESLCQVLQEVLSGTRQALWDSHEIINLSLYGYIFNIENHFEAAVCATYYKRWSKITKFSKLYLKKDTSLAMW